MCFLGHWLAGLCFIINLQACVCLCMHQNSPSRFHVHVGMHVCACIYVCIPVCTPVCAGRVMCGNVCVCVCVYISMSMCTLYMPARECMLMYAGTKLHGDAWVCVCTDMHPFVHGHLPVCMFLSVSVHRAHTPTLPGLRLREPYLTEILRSLLGMRKS